MVPARRVGLDFVKLREIRFAFARQLLQHHVKGLPRRAFSAVRSSVEPPIGEKVAMRGNSRHPIPHKDQLAFAKWCLECRGGIEVFEQGNRLFVRIPFVGIRAHIEYLRVEDLLSFECQLASESMNSPSDST